MSQIFEIQVNGQPHRVEAEGERTLLSVLRDNLDLTGTKYGCGEGQCGACTVLLDGVPTRSCLTPIGGIGRRKVATVEGLAQNGRLHPLQEAFLKVGAMQCSYCTSGMLMSAFALLQKKPQPAEDEIIRSMNGNICRCGTYQRIIAAIKLGAQALREASR